MKINNLLLNEHRIAPLDRERLRGDVTSSRIAIHDEMRADSSAVHLPLGTIQEMSQTLYASPPARITREHEHQLLLTYQKRAKNSARRSGAKSFLAYLQSQGIQLAGVTTSDLGEWSLTPNAVGQNLPPMQALQGAKDLCALAAEAGHIDTQRAKDLAEFKRPRFDVNSLRLVLQNPELTTKEREYHIRLNYLRKENNPNRQAGASGFLAYLERQGSSLAQACISDLEQWAQTTITSGPGKGNIPSKPAFDGAKALCVLASEVGYLDPQNRESLAACIRPQFDVNSLRTFLQNPDLTPKERDEHIRLKYHSSVHNAYRYAGANGIVAYLETHGKSLADVTAGDLELWALTPLTATKGKIKLPDAQAFEAAKALCALAAQVGHIDAQRAKDIAECCRPYYYLSSLHTVLQNTALTPKERDNQILLNYQSKEYNPNRQLGANGIVAYLETHAKSLAQVTIPDLEQWALTPTPGKRELPSARAFEGAKALCRLAAEVGELDAQQAKIIAEYARPQFTVDALRTILQDPTLTLRERDYHIRLTYQSAEQNINLLAGANGILAYLESQSSSLAQVTTRDLEKWALKPLVTPKGKPGLPSEQAFRGAQALCALAAQVGHIDELRAKEIAELTRPQGNADSLRSVLQNPALLPQDREYHIQLHYQSCDKDPNRQAGAKALLAYLKSKQSSLAKLTKAELETWALTPLPTGRDKGSLPSLRAFEGAKALCAIAAEVGHIDMPRAKELALCPRPQFDVESLRLVLQNPQLSAKEREYQIRLNFQSRTNNTNRQAGAKAILAYLHNKGSSLSDITTSDLEHWALSTNPSGHGKGKLPNVLLFEGAKAFCALAAEVGHIDAQRAKALAEYTRPHFHLNSLSSVLQNPALSPKERDEQIRLNYQSAENNAHRQAGAHGFLAYLEVMNKCLAEVTTSDLEQWALTPIAAGKNLPNSAAFEGAKALCAVAAKVGELDEQIANDLAQCLRPKMDLNSLRLFLQNPLLSHKEREYRIRLTYQSMDIDTDRQAGARSILAYLQNKGSSLAEVTINDLEQWGVTVVSTGQGKGSLPSKRVFDGAKQLCVLAAEVGHIDAERAKEFAACVRPRLDVNVLRITLQNPALTPQERDHHIRLNYQSAENNLHYQTGANGILKYLESQGKSLADVTASDLKEWTLTPSATGASKGALSTSGVFEGAKALCALAAQVGHIDAQRANTIATCSLPQPRPQRSSGSIAPAGHKRLRIDDQGASISMTNSIAFPQSEDLDRQFALSHQHSTALDRERA